LSFSIKFLGFLVEIKSRICIS